MTGNDICVSWILIKLCLHLDKIPIAYWLANLADHLTTEIFQSQSHGTLFSCPNVDAAQDAWFKCGALYVSVQHSTYRNITKILRYYKKYQFPYSMYGNENKKIYIKIQLGKTRIVSLGNLNLESFKETWEVFKLETSFICRSWNKQLFRPRSYYKTKTSAPVRYFDTWSM